MAALTASKFEVVTKTAAIDPFLSLYPPLLIIQSVVKSTHS